MVRLHAVLVTYRRPVELVRSVEVLAEQTLPVSSLIVVDNDTGAQDAISSMTEHAPFDIRVVDAGDNLGPAGGFALGIRLLLGSASDDDWILLLDDDDPLTSPDVLCSLTRRRDELLVRGVALGGIGMKGARFDRRTVRTRALPLDGPALLEVDHLHGGYAPLYSVRALRSAGNFRPELFWGFEELDVGLRLNESGWRMFMDAELLRSCAWTDKLSATRANPRFLATEGDARRYYKLRNLIVIVREQRSGIVPILVLFARAVLKPLVNLPLRPRAASTLLTWNLRAARDAMTNRLGRTFPL